MQNEVNLIEKDEEIDLFNVFKATKGVLNRNKKLFFGFLIAGILIGLIYYYATPKTFKSRMIISSSLFQGPSFVLILDHLKLLLEEGNYQELANALNIKVAEAEKIKKIDVFSSRIYAQEEFGERVSFKEDKTTDMTERKEEFVIEAYVKDNAILKSLENGILYFITSNPTIRESSNVKAEVLNEMKRNISNQRAGLDSLKNSLATILTEEKPSKDIYIASPGAMYNDMISLFNAELRITEALIASKIEVIESFRIYKKQYSPKILPSIAGFTFVAMALYVVTLIFIEANRKEQNLR